MSAGIAVLGEACRALIAARQCLLAARLDGDISTDIAGRYWSEETESVLRADTPFRVEATCRASRIYHSGAAAQRVRQRELWSREKAAPLRRKEVAFPCSELHVEVVDIVRFQAGGVAPLHHLGH